MSYIKYESKMGAPSKLTPEIIAEFSKAISEVLVIRQAAGLIGVSHATIYNWINKGEEDSKKDLSNDFVHFFYTVKVAQAREVRKLIADVRERPTGWQACAWLLERCFREDFGQDNEKIRELLEKQDKFEKMLDQILSNPIQGRLSHGKLDKESDKT